MSAFLESRWMVEKGGICILQIVRHVDFRPFTIAIIANISKVICSQMGLDTIIISSSLAISVEVDKNGIQSFQFLPFNGFLSFQCNHNASVCTACLLYVVLCSNTAPNML